MYVDVRCSSELVNVASLALPSLLTLSLNAATACTLSVYLVSSQDVAVLHEESYEHQCYVSCPSIARNDLALEHKRLVP